jgi:N-acetylmuramoyl-L-alanine amidase
MHVQAALLAVRALTVVLDPGHGGSNVGAAGVVEGLYEKRLTLILARGVERRLVAAGVNVVLTRSDDRFLSLRERVRRSAVAGADLFVSLHANASPARSQRGFETYILTPEALDVEARAIRFADGPPRPGLDEETGRILDDVEQGTALAGAVALAARMQSALAEVWGKPLDRGIKQAPMDVLMGHTAPAVLVEVGFIDHPIEGTELLRHDVREKIADAIAKAILESLP